MKLLIDFAKRKPILTSALLWIVSIFITIGCFAYQDKTGPTYPLEGDFETAHGIVQFKFLRSQTIGKDLPLVLLSPPPLGVEGYVQYRRFSSDDEWTTMALKQGSFEFSRRGRRVSLSGKGAELPGLPERAGKYEFYVYIADGAGEQLSVTGELPIIARYKAAVPGAVLLVHILAIFASMTFAIRTTLGALIDGKFKGLIWATVASLILGAFVFGPLVQWYAFGVWWSGVPFGYDWTDNKVLVELIFWVLALYLNRGQRRNRGSVYLAGVVMLLVYFIPHSIFGSEFDYRTGSGHGTAG